MEAIWPEQPAFGFGIDSLNPHAPRGIEAVGGQTKREIRDQIVQTCPQVPGVYGMLSRKGDLIYVGKSKSLRSRLLSYFADSNKDEKGGRIIENTRAIQWETQPSDFAALVREQQLIRRFSPRWNVQGVPKRQRPVYLCLGRVPAPYFFLAAKPPQDCVGVEGPFFGAKRMQRAIDALNKVFRLRDCSQQQVFHFAEQLQLFDLEHRPGCLRLELNTCLGPCAAACTGDAYQTQVNAAQSFLEGFNDEPIVALQDQMESASANQQYELAGRAYETLASVKYVHRKLAMLAKARRDYTFIYPVAGYDGCHTWYLIHGGELAAVAAAPKNAEQYAKMKPTLEHWKAITANTIDRGHGAYPHTLNLVATWFRKNRTERQRTFLPEQAGRKYRAVLKKVG
ncbi:excinuclease ABC subunit C [Rhodopirellula maiorica SM1]|uniref:Excinuclease ABC subunit C n=1 Tax=Rhodopirellula maiorica SM1 TaxID=1265738 RepID=M5RC67_9BACT|nr:GIY-YIG nuclease family protein [Rhodopirellula maiorica]EMI16661.1 excinuclease ABC subunit C [Rhodopirellula maiorica SM1]